MKPSKVAKEAFASRNAFARLMADVTMFHRVCGVPVLTKPCVPPADRLALRAALIDEEANKELIPAIRAGDLHGIADGCIDVIYVAIGTLLECGIPGDRIWDIVHPANMGKADPITGMVLRREDGKILKPEHWVSPDWRIRAVLKGS